MSQALTSEQLTKCTIWAEKIAFEMARCNEAGAVSMVKAGLLAMQADELEQKLLDTPLATIVSQRHGNALAESCDVLTIGDLLNSTTDRVLMAKNFKEISLITVLQQVLAFTVKRCLKLELEAEQHNEVR